MSRRVAAVVLAAGESRRMGVENKLLARIDGEPMVARAVDAALASAARPVVVVTGHEADGVRAALGRRELDFVQHPDYAAGMGASLAAGIAALGDVDGALVCLGDMPWVRATHLDALIAAFDPDAGRAICVPLCRGRRGHPVLFAARYFGELRELTGDVGARGVIEAHVDVLHLVPIDDPGVLRDVDSPEEL